MTFKDGLTLEEAIKHCREVTERQGNNECGQDHAQMSKWLEELVEFRKTAEGTHPQTGGGHLRAIRVWMQWNAFNGDRVEWGSDEPLNLKHNLTPKILEGIAQGIREAVEEDVGVMPMVRPFVREMERKLEINKEKTLEGASVFEMFQGMLVEVQELLDELKQGNLHEAMIESADVANFAMFIHTLLRLDSSEHVRKSFSHQAVLSTFFAVYEAELAKVKAQHEAH